MLSRLNVSGLAAAASVATLLGASCDGPGNSGVYTPDPNLVRAVPWFNGALPAVENGQALIPTFPVYPPIGFGVPDVGSQRTDCSGLAGLEFSPGWFDTFGPLAPGERGIALGWASYDDLSKYSFHTPGDATWYPGFMPDAMTKLFSGAWGLPSDNVAGPSCDGTPNEWALHFRGGLFRKWGGGLSHAFTDPDMWYRSKDRLQECARPGVPNFDLCPPALAPDAKFDTAGLPTKLVDGNDLYKQSHDFFDATRGKYEGVAFWARRGPEGFDRALVILTDKHTSARLARENQTFCRRVRECHTKCLSGVPCAPSVPGDPKSIWRCFDPSQTANGQPPPIAIETQMDQMYPRCGPSACTSPDSYQDPDFQDKQCRPYSYPAGEESGEYCWDPGDPPPPGRDERCQDGWQVSVELTPDWKFHAIPFTQFRQAQFGKRAPYLDLKSLDTIAFGAVMGWSDMYFDNVTFYRRK
jgi:hypothetical protein